MAKILVFDFKFSDAETFLHNLAPAQTDNVLGGFPYARILTIHDGINRTESQLFGSFSNHDNNYDSIDNSDQVYIRA
ncbi:MAG: hypothetical protein KME40_15440 [Komarekiella atlantica HA4396-MV6]|jgi:hypothetical protein|nr:hypothetical protein [Komarekiella atlantica HA4396-MV6]